MNDHGRLVIDGRTFPIQEIRLERGRVFFDSFLVPGPITWGDDLMVTLFGRDGVGICQQDAGAPPNVQAGEAIRLTYDWQIETVTPRQ